MSISTHKKGYWISVFEMYWSIDISTGSEKTTDHSISILLEYCIIFQYRYQYFMRVKWFNIYFQRFFVRRSEITNRACVRLLLLMNWFNMTFQRVLQQKWNYKLSICLASCSHELNPYAFSCYFLDHISNYKLSTNVKLLPFMNWFKMLIQMSLYQNSNHKVNTSVAFCSHELMQYVFQN